MKATGLRSAFLCALVLSATAVLSTSPAQAHDDEADLVVTSAQPVDDTTVDYAVRLTFRNDGHGARGATVTAVAEGPAGAVAPVALQPGSQEGDYQGRIAFPAGGSWQVRFTSVSPQATVVQAQEITATTTTAPSTTSSTAPTDSDDTAPLAGNPVGSSDDEGGSGAGTVAFFAVIFGMLAIVALATISARRARRARATAS